MLTPLRPARRNHASRPASPRSNRRDDSQQTLNFDADTASHHSLDMKVEAVIYCDAPVALPIHRLIAAAVDASIIAIALGVFLAIFYLSGGNVAWTKTTALVMLGAVWAVAQFYRLLWCLGDGDSPGMRFAGLRLVNFDGRLPDREQRGVRQAAYLLSMLSVGLGLIWALVDEENLTWHDHISKTFPTPG
jgi:uncharacterized RDD family membrane protein YckC